MPGVQQGSGARHAAAIRPVLVQRNSANWQVGVALLFAQVGTTGGAQGLHGSLVEQIVRRIPHILSCRQRSNSSIVRAQATSTSAVALLFTVQPSTCRVVANDAASYQYLVESIRMFPDQESWSRVRALPCSAMFCQRYGHCCPAAPDCLVCRRVKCSVVFVMFPFFIPQRSM